MRSRRARPRLVLFVLWAAVLALLILVMVGAARGNAHSVEQPCTHGLSSVGPVSIADGKVAGGSTTPVTEACLP